MITKYREWWIGKTQDGFDRWLSSKDPSNDECIYNFLSSINSNDKCVEHIPVIEKSAYIKLKEKAELLATALEKYNTADFVATDALKIWKKFNE